MNLPPERIERLAVLVPAVGLLFGLAYWAINSANTAVQTANALATFNAQVMARLDHIDAKIESVPVIASQVADMREQLAGTQGGYANLASRLQALELNEAANHSDASRALGRKP